MVARPAQIPASGRARPSRARRLCALALAAIALAVPALAATGCGGDDAVDVTGGVVRLDVDEYRIIPDKVSVPAGKVKILIHDTGLLTHNVHIEDPSKRDEQGNPLDLGGTPTAHPGVGPTTREAVTLTLAPGTYRMVCTIANHEVLGQYGTLIVK
jgi:plastocyanin